jgi:hypothetical protein
MQPAGITCTKVYVKKQNDADILKRDVNEATRL